MTAQAAPKTYRPMPQGQPLPAQGNTPQAIGTVSRFKRWRWTEFWLLLIPSILSIIGMLIVIVVRPETAAWQWEWKDLWMSFLFIGLFYGTHVWLNLTR